MVFAGIALLAVTVAVSAWLVIRQVGAVSHKLTPREPRDIPSSTDFATTFAVVDVRLKALESDVKDLYLAVADGIDHVDRNEKRVRGIVLGAKRRFEASDYFDPGVDAEADTLPEHDASGERAEGVLPLQEPVESGEDRSPWSAVPGRLA